MTIPKPCRSALATATLALVAGGSMIAAMGTAASAATARLPQAQSLNATTSWLSPAAISGPVIYVSDNSSDFQGVRIYSQTGRNQQPIGAIGAQAPAGLAVDNGGNLYVVSDQKVLMFQRGHVRPSKTYTAGIDDPFSVAVGKDGTVYVANLGSYGHLGTVGVYRNGSTKPSLTIHDFDGMALGVTIDKSDNLLVSYISELNRAGQINIYAPGSTSGRDLGVTLTDPYGITLDGRGDYVVADEHGNNGGGLIDVFSPGAKMRLAKFASFLPVGVAFNSVQNLLYSAEVDNGVVVRAYPSGKIVNMIGSGRIRADGVALSPAAPR